ncbi:hypothetical protein ISU82_17365 [Leptospira borgpetersenii serovar Balcanica]|nr:hypothetical protein [Leptospira borgpetersenii serovar Balcanica]MBE8368169.1 hypothetical protein [Leptospira borgpetersenii serovar Balcanica]MBE8424683.1 hypothetical protein [Leptospira borgpetersenii serovar Balcanica]MBF3351779.1 hypothetical protein [Leptospira borgpetersenii serovar Balcanica]
MSQNLGIVRNSDKSARTIKSVRKPVNYQRAMIRGNSYIQRAEDSVAAMPLPQKTVLGQFLKTLDPKECCSRIISSKTNVVLKITSVSSDLLSRENLKSLNNKERAEVLARIFFNEFVEI